MLKRLSHAVPSAAAALVVLTSTAFAAEYDITIRNATGGQVITPPVVIAHDGNYRLFTIGQASSVPLYTLAETGSPAELAEAAATDPYVADVALQAEPGVTMPGNETIIRLSTDAPYVDFAAMLALTNDAFVSFRNVALPGDGETITLRPATYDAGSEANNEGQAYVPGLGGMERATDGAEGFVHVHSGLSGIGDLALAQHNWRDPAIEIVVTNVAMTN